MSKKQTVVKRVGENYSDRTLACAVCDKEKAYLRVAEMSARGENRDRTTWHQIIPICKDCRPKFEKRNDFENWIEPSR